MSQYSELIGSFKRTGDFPLEANYIFADEAELLEFYEDELNATTQHNGLLKVVLDDGNGEQSLYWCYTDDDGNYAWEKILDSTVFSLISDVEGTIADEISDIESTISDLTDALNEEITNRQEADDAIWGVSNPLSLDESLNSISKIIDAITELQEISDNYATQEDLDELYNTIEGETTPTTDFQTLRGVEDFVRALQSQVVNICTSLQKELDNTQSGIGLEADGSYSADASTNFLTGATSVMNALRILDAELQSTKESAGVVQSIEYDATTETIKIVSLLSSGDTQEIDFDIYDIIREWDVNNEDSSAITLTRTTVIDGIDQLSADVKISEDEDNNLQNVDGELFVPIPTVENIMCEDETLASVLSWHNVE